MNDFSKLFEEEKKEKSQSKKGKKLCNSCKNYIGVRTKICNCGFNFEKQIDLELNPSIYVFEYVRLDTWEQYQAQKILKKEQNYYWTPTQIKPLCYSLEELMNRYGFPKEKEKRIIIKCELTNEYKIDPNKSKRVGKLRKLIVKEICPS